MTGTFEFWSDQCVVWSVTFCRSGSRPLWNAISSQHAMLTWKKKKTQRGLVEPQNPQLFHYHFEPFSPESKWHVRIQSSNWMNERFFLPFPIVKKRKFQKWNTLKILIPKPSFTLREILPTYHCAVSYTLDKIKLKIGMVEVSQKYIVSS